MEIYIDRLHTYSYIGDEKEERLKGQDFYVSVRMKLDDMYSYDSDELDKTVDYSAVLNIITDYMDNAKCYLLETACEDIASMIILSYDLVSEITVTISKPNPPIEGDFNDIQVSCNKKWVKAYLSLGSNMGDKDGYINDAIHRLQLNDKIRRVRTSSIITTKPYGNENQDDFRNAVCELETIYSPFELLNICHDIENVNGRVRKEHWGPRTLDVDILLYGDEVINSEQLIVPHIDMHNRLFVLEPLAELAPGAYHPIMRKSAVQMVEECRRINKEKKGDLEDLYANLGMTLPEAVNIFFEKSLMVGGIPFDVRMPRYNRETEEAIQEARDIMSGKVEAKSYNSAKELFEEIDEE